MPGKNKNALVSGRALVLANLLVIVCHTTIFPADIDYLTKEEREWLKKHGPIKYAPDPYFFPFEFLGPDAQAQGITPDILNLISQKLNIEVLTIRSRSWSDVLESFKQGNIDLLGTLTRTEERETYLKFTTPYLNVPVALFVNKNKPQFSDIKNLNGRKVGVVKNYGAEHWLRKNHPEIDLFTVMTPREGLLLLEMEQLDAFVEVLPVGLGIITENSLFSIRHSRKPLYTTPQHFAVSKTNDVLYNIMEKGIALISEGEKQEIFQKWAREMPMSDHRLLNTILLIAGITSACALILLLVVKSLKKIIRKQTEEIRKSEDFFRGIFENNPLPGAIIELETGIILEVNKRFKEKSGYKEEELKGRSTIELGFWINPGERRQLVEILKKNRVIQGFEQEFRVKGGKILNIVVHGQVFEKEGKETVLYLVEDVTEKKQTELIHRRLADIVESTDAFIITTDVNLNVLYANGSAQKNLMLSVHSKIFDLLTKENKNVLTNEIIPAVVKDGFWTGELSIKSANGGLIPTFSVVVAHKRTDNTIDFYSFIFRDIRELKKTYEKLMEREEKLRQIIEHSTQVFYVHDTEYRLIYVSPQVKDILGYEVEEVLGKSTKQFLSDNPENEIGNEIAELAIRTGERQRPYELELIAKDGRKIWTEIHESPVVSNGKTVAIVGSLTDITRRKEAERKLKEREALLEGIAQNSPDLIIIFDLITRECVYTNKDFANFLGYKNGSVSGIKDLLMLMPDEDANKLLQHFNDLSQGEDGVVYEIEYRVKTATGEYIWLHARDSIFKRDESGNVVQVLSVQKNITKEKKITKEKEEAQLRIHQSSKMQALGELASGVAHDLNNYLTVIKSALFSGREMADLNPDDVSLMREAANSVELIENLCKQLLVFSRQEVMVIKPVNINDVIIQEKKFLSRTIRENVEIKLDLAPNIPLINADRSMIQTSLMNLVVNAQDAMPNGGTITISTGITEIGTEIVEREMDLQKGKYVMIKVSDTGVGISKEIMGKIFEPYFTTKPMGRGTGLGLSIVHGIVRQHGGFVNVDSEVGKGTTFTLYFPVPDKLVEVQEKVVSTKVKLPEGKETILVVEDNEAVRKTTVVCLRRLGYNILEANNGVSALKLVENYHGIIHLLFTDIVMPGNINGLELFDILRQKIPGLKVLYTSGHPGEVLQIKADLIANGVFIKKPFDPFILSEKIRECLNGAK